MTALSLIHQIFELLADHCTAEQGGRKLFIRSVNALLERSTLCSTADIDTVWRATWDKPLYADQYAHIATRLMDQLRAMQPCVLDDFRQLPQSPELLRGLKRYTVKHERLLELAKHWEDIHATHTATARVVEALFDKGLPLAEVEVSARRLLGAPGYVDRSDRSTLFSRLTAIKGYGQITALHICTDLGYPVYKPDRWVLRFAAVDRSVRATIESALPPDVALGRVTQGYLERNLHLVLFAIDHLTKKFAIGAQPQDILDLGVRFRRHRFVDLMVVKFGMTAEPAFGLVISGKDALLRNPDLARRYPDLLPIALEMEAVVQSKASARRGRTRRRPPGNGGGTS